MTLEGLLRFMRPWFLQAALWHGVSLFSHLFDAKDGQTLSFATSSDLLSKEATNIVSTLIVDKSAFFVCYCSGQDEWSSKDRRIRLSGWRYARISRGQAWKRVRGHTAAWNRSRDTSERVSVPSAGPAIAGQPLYVALRLFSWA